MYKFQVQLYESPILKMENVHPLVMTRLKSQHPVKLGQTPNDSMWISNTPKTILLLCPATKSKMFFTNWTQSHIKIYSSGFFKSADVSLNSKADFLGWNWRNISWHHWKAGKILLKPSLEITERCLYTNPKVAAANPKRHVMIVLTLIAWLSSVIHLKHLKKMIYTSDV